MKQRKKSVIPDRHELGYLTNEIEQGFMKPGGWRSCWYLLGKLVDGMMERAGEHPLVMEESGTDNIDRCHRVIDKLSSQLKDPNDPEKADWYWDDRCLEDAASSIPQAVSSDDIGDIVELRPIRELPVIKVRVTEDGYELVKGDEQ